MTRNAKIGAIGGGIGSVIASIVFGGGYYSWPPLLGSLGAAVVIVPLVLLLYGPGLRYPRVLAGTVLGLLCVISLLSLPLLDVGKPQSQSAF